MDKITVQHYKDAVEIIIRGDLNMHNADKLLNEFKSLSSDGKTFRIIGINCEKMESIDSSGLGVLISLSKQAEAGKSEFYICDLNRKVSTLFDISHMSMYFQLIPGEEFRKIVQP